MTALFTCPRASRSRKRGCSSWTKDMRHSLPWMDARTVETHPGPRPPAGHPRPTGPAGRGAQPEVPAEGAAGTGGHHAGAHGPGTAAGPGTEGRGPAARHHEEI